MQHTHLTNARFGRPAKQSGFTIIEVLIVLAIAALIIVVVLLAVPAVQRSQRNQSRKTDAKNLLAAVSEFASNNGGTLPASQGDINTVTGNVKFGYLQTANVFYGTTPTDTVSVSSTTPAANVNTVEDMNIYIGYTCTSATNKAVAGTVKNVAVQYVVEQNSGNGTLQCLSN